MFAHFFLSATNDHEGALANYQVAMDCEGGEGNNNSDLLSTAAFGAADMLEALGDASTAKSLRKSYKK